MVILYIYCFAFATEYVLFSPVKSVTKNNASGSGTSRNVGVLAQRRMEIARRCAWSINDVAKLVFYGLPDFIHTPRSHIAKLQEFF